MPICFKTLKTSLPYRIFNLILSLRQENFGSCLYEVWGGGGVEGGGAGGGGGAILTPGPLRLVLHGGSLSLCVQKPCRPWLGPLEAPDRWSAFLSLMTRAQHTHTHTHTHTPLYLGSIFQSFYPQLVLVAHV